MLIISTGVTPIEFNAFTKSFKLLLPFILTTLPAPLSTPIVEFEKPTVEPCANEFGCETSFVVETVTVTLP